jgi:hypothetical protein
VPVHTFRLRAEGSPQITVENSLIRGVRVSVDGRQVRRSRDRGRPYWPIPLAGGGERRLYVTGTITGLRAMAGDEEIRLERRLAWWELLIAFLPIGLITIGGLLGGLVGGVGLIAGLWVMRQPWPPGSRLAFGVAVFAFSVAAWWVLLQIVAGLLRLG